MDRSPDGSKIAVGHSGSPYLTVFNTSNWSTVTLGTAVGSSVSGVAFSPSGGHLAVGISSYPYICVYETATWTKITALSPMGGNGAALAWSPDGSTLVAVYFGGANLTAYRTDTWAVLTGTPSLPAAGKGVSFSPDGTHVLVTHAVVAPGGPTFSAYKRSDWSLDLTYLSALRASSYSDSHTACNVETYTSAARFLRGTVRDDAGDPAARVVRVYRRSDAALVATTVSDATTGEYEISVTGDYTTEYDVQFSTATGEALNDLFFARVTSSDT